MDHRDMRYLDIPSLQERPITLGELLLREENREAMETSPPKSMGRTMSPTRCLGSLASGRPRRSRGRTLTRSSTSAAQAEDSPSESEQSEQRRRHRSRPVMTPASSRWRKATAEARIRNFHYLMNEIRASRRRGSSVTRPRHPSLERSVSSDIHFNPFPSTRRSSTGRRLVRSRSASSFGNRSGSTLRGRPQQSSMANPMPGSSRMSNSNNTRVDPSYRYMREGRPHSGRTSTETRNNSTNAAAPQSEISEPMRRFIDFAAEFIPVQQPQPDAEPPEWSLNVTAADLGPFAVGRSALSRARSLAIMGVLSQVNEDSTDAQPDSNEN